MLKMNSLFINLTKSDNNQITINTNSIEHYEKTNGTVANTKLVCASHIFYIIETKEYLDNILINRQ